MELKWLRDFISLANSGSFSRSAQDRNITQPAFSRRIKALEHWCGVTLVDRSTYPLSLTPAGQRFYESATEILQRIDQERAELRDRHEEDLLVSFAAPHSLATHLFPSLLDRIEAHAGALRSRVTSDNLQICVDSLVHGGCDFLIAFHHSELPLTLDPQRYHHRIVLQDRLMPASLPLEDGTPAHPLPLGGDVEVPVLCYGPGSYLGHLVSHLVGSNNSALRKVVYESALTEALKTMTLAGRGTAWLPSLCIASELEHGRLMAAGGDPWQVSLEVRIYRWAGNTKPIVERVWQAIETL